MYALIDRVSFYNFKMAAMTSFHAEKFCHLVSAHATCAWRLCSSVRQFLIYSTFVLVICYEDRTSSALFSGLASSGLF